MSEQQYQGKYTDIILEKVERGETTLQEIVEQRDRHIAVRGENVNEEFVASRNEALTALQTQQSQQQ